MLENAQKLKTCDAKTTFGPLFRIQATPICCQHDIFLRKGAGNLPWVARSVISIIFELNSGDILVTFGTYANQFVA